MKKSLFLFLGFLLTQPWNTFSQVILNQYVEEGLKNNLVLTEKNFELNRSLLALKDAKSYFLPSLEFTGNYTLANGGRTINFPIGDLLNPVYSTLNRLTNTSSFPQLENVSEQFLADNFYDARFRASMPIFNRDIQYQKQIREKQMAISELELLSYKAILIQDIKLAYYNFCTAHSAEEVIFTSKALVEQNLKDNQSLLANGKVLPAAVLRAESEVESIQAQLIDAQNKKKNAANYLNFLLNRPMDSEVIFEPQVLNESVITGILKENNLGTRPELLQIQTATSIQETALKSGKDYWLPKLNTFADLGSQAFDWQFNRQSRYLIWGVNMSVPLFQGGRNRNQIQRAQLGIRSTQNQEQLLLQKLNLELQLAKNEFISQQASLRSAEKKLETANTYFRLIERGYREGVNSLIEFLDARNQLTQAALQKTISTYNLLKAYAQLERQLQIENL
jgi:outer membrane protein